MNEILKKSLVINLMVLTLGLAVTAYAAPTVPAVTITAPTGTQYEDTFPMDVDVTLQLSLANPTGTCTLDAISRIEVAAQIGGGDPATIYSYDGSPFSSSDSCPQDLTFSWTVPQPGTYNLIATVTHGNADGEDTEEVTFIQLAVEHTAPPAVANAFIKTNCDKLTGGARGAIISEIAYRFSTGEYGPKPGPYNAALIKEDVVTLSGGACHQ